eukprot:366305-Chlamydomonas_euryale.AAC.5
MVTTSFIVASCSQTLACLICPSGNSVPSRSTSPESTATDVVRAVQGRALLLHADVSRKPAYFLLSASMHPLQGLSMTACATTTHVCATTCCGSRQVRGVRSRRLCSLSACHPGGPDAV